MLADQPRRPGRALQQHDVVGRLGQRARGRARGPGGTSPGSGSGRHPRGPGPRSSSYSPAPAAWWASWARSAEPSSFKVASATAWSRRRSRPRSWPSTASRTSACRKLNSSSSSSSSRPRSTRARRWAMSSSSVQPVMRASTSNDARRPSTAAASTTRRSSGDRPSSWRCTSSVSDHGSGWRAEVVRVAVARRHEQLLQEEGVAAGAVEEGVHDRARELAVVHRGQEGRHLGRDETVEAQLVDLVAALEARQHLGGRHAPGQLVGPVGADEQQRRPRHARPAARRRPRSRRRPSAGRRTRPAPGRSPSGASMASITARSWSSPAGGSVAEQ